MQRARPLQTACRPGLPRQPILNPIGWLSPGWADVPVIRQSYNQPLAAFIAGTIAPAELHGRPKVIELFIQPPGPDNLLDTRPMGSGLLSQAEETIHVASLDGLGL